MRVQLIPGAARRMRGWAAVALLLGSGAMSPALGQTAAEPVLPVPGAMPQARETPLPSLPEAPTPEPNLLQTGCSSCGDGLMGLAGGCASCGCGAQCIPGRFKSCCPPCDCNTCLGRFVNGLFECVCCPDPCYEGRWIPVADAAFFTVAPRPITQMRLRTDVDRNFQFPDRAEYFWAAQRTVPPTTPPVVGGRVSTPKGPAPAVREIDYNQFSYYTEVAVGNFSAFVEIPYREVDSEGHVVDFSGFADIVAGTKSLIVDCPLGQLGLQFAVYTPSGQASKGLGTGHVSLEPSLQIGCRLAADTYLQTQWAYWIPIGGDQIYAGDIFHLHWSLNQVLWRPLPRNTLVGVLEFNDWSVLDGAYSDPSIRVASAVAANRSLIPQKARTNICSIGPGIRYFICDSLDIGVGSAFAITDNNWGDTIIRSEFRWRF